MIRWFGRPDRPPRIAGAGRDERVVSWADTDDGAVVAATTRGLWWPAAGEHRLIGWQVIDKAVWRDDRLAVTEAVIVDDLLVRELPPVVVGIARPRDLPPVVRRRVEANIVRSEVQPVAGGSARFVARRIPGRDGLVWWARLEGTTEDTPQVRAEIVARIDVLRVSRAD